ncbi:MAG: PorP/SprF family type IX secretion system membrane protein [Bacteroidetes bacterium]|nr:PorP/SprF family type IX secretion system membrane protein [Bacteroidota bacterium]HET6243128.1 PorP/SprF family type IX secretion system membrane protein [Bacteroidia bacterium]
MKIRSFLLLILTGSFFGLHAQDIHYSQFISAPYNLNPALTGAFVGDARFTANQRTQWRSVTTPYQTFGGFVDMRNVAFKNFHPGISVYNDKAGDSQFGTFQLNISGAYSKKLGNYNRHRLTLGIQTGITQRKLDYNNLSFDNQYNGSSYDSDLSSGENFSRQSYMYFNLNSGIVYNYRINKKVEFNTGLAIFNINKPDQSLYDKEKIKLDRRYTLFLSADVVIASNRVNVLPSLLIMTQGTFREYLAGSSVKFTLQNNSGKYSALHFGSWLRMKDSGFILLGMDYDNVYVGLSYDFNYSNLVPASNYRGGFEVSVIYILRKFVPGKIKYKYCPGFI